MSAESRSSVDPHPPRERVSDTAPSVRDVTSSPGKPLPSVVRSSMESKFGHDFGSVRIHNDDVASESADQLGARAWTLGSHVAFGRGEFAPQTTAGRILLSHELAHVVQFRQRGKPLTRNESERGAREVAHDVASGRTTVVHGATRSTIPLLEEKKKSKGTQPINPNATIVPMGGKDIVMIRGIRQYAIIETKDGTPLIRRSTSAGPLQETDPQAGGKPYRYSIHGAYGNAHSNLTVRPGADQAKVHSSVFPSVQFNVGASGVYTPPPKKKPGILVASNVRAKGPTPEESAGKGAAGPEVEAALDKLRKAKFGQALDAAAGPDVEVWKGEAHGDISLLDATRVVYYVTSNRIYVMDRSGFVLEHVDPDSGPGEWLLKKIIPGPQQLATLNRGSVSLQPGTYFVGGMVQGLRSAPKGSQIEHLDRAVKVDDSGVTPATGQVHVAGSTKGVTPVLQQQQQARADKGGIAIIVSESRGSADKKWNGNNVLRALTMAKSLVGIALAREWARIKQDVLGELTELVADEAVDQLVQRVAGGAGVFILQAWSKGMDAIRASEIANVAAYADNETEIGIAAQGFARMAAQQAIQAAISQIKSGAGKLAAGAKAKATAPDGADAAPAAKPKPEEGPGAPTAPRKTPAVPETPEASAAPAPPAPAPARVRKSGPLVPAQATPPASKVQDGPVPTPTPTTSTLTPTTPPPQMAKPPAKHNAAKPVKVGVPQKNIETNDPEPAGIPIPDDLLPGAKKKADPETIGEPVPAARATSPPPVRNGSQAAHGAQKKPVVVEEHEHDSAGQKFTLEEIAEASDKKRKEEEISPLLQEIADATPQVEADNKPSKRPADDAQEFDLTVPDEMLPQPVAKPEASVKPKASAKDAARSADEAPASAKQTEVEPPTPAAQKQADSPEPAAALPIKQSPGGKIVHTANGRELVFKDGLYWYKKNPDGTGPGGVSASSNPDFYELKGGRWRRKPGVKIPSEVKPSKDLSFDAIAGRKPVTYDPDVPATALGLDKSLHAKVSPYVATGDAVARVRGKTSVNSVKAQVAEEVSNTLAAQDVAKVEPVREGSTVKFYRGDEISGPAPSERSAGAEHAQLTDGVIAEIYKEGDVLKVRLHKIYETKSGTASATELPSQVELGLERIRELGLSLKLPKKGGGVEWHKFEPDDISMPHTAKQKDLVTVFTPQRVKPPKSKLQGKEVAQRKFTARELPGLTERDLELAALMILKNKVPRADGEGESD